MRGETEIMYFFEVLSGLLLLGFLITIVNPNWLKKKDDKEEPITRKQASIGAVVCLVLFFVFGALNHNSTTTTTTAPISTQASATATATATSSSPVTTSTPQKVPGSLGITPKEFIDRWNQGLANVDSLPLKINNLKIDTGSVQDTFTYMFNDSHGLMGTVNKSDGTIRSIMILASGKDLADSSKAAAVIISWGLLIQTTNPDLTPDQRGAILQDLGILDTKAQLEGINKSVIRNNVKYNISQDDTTGLTFIASDPMDK